MSESTLSIIQGSGSADLSFPVGATPALIDFETMMAAALYRVASRFATDGKAAPGNDSLLFDWLVTDEVVALIPAASLCGPKHVVKVGKTLVFSTQEINALFDSIDLSTAIGLRDGLQLCAGISSDLDAGPRLLSSKQTVMI